MSSAPGPTVRPVLVRDLLDGQELDQVLLVRSAEVRARRGGGDFLRLALGDRSGHLTAIVWDDVARARELCRAGTPVRVAGRFEVHARWGPQLALRSVREAASGSFDPCDLLDGPPRPAERMEADLHALVATVQDPHLRALLDRTLGPGASTWAAFRDAPAAKHFHQAYAPRAARALPVGGSGASARSARPSQASTATSRSPARCCTTSASSRPTRSTRRPSTSPTPAACRARSRSATSASAARSRRIDGLPAATAQARAAHHPQPSRLARARQPGRPLHARGHARAHDRQPRRAAGLLRPPREGAGAGRVVVAVRPRASARAPTSLGRRRASRRRPEARPLARSRLKVRKLRARPAPGAPASPAGFYLGSRWRRTPRS